MQDYLDIGRGRPARRMYRLNQVSIVPSRRTRSSREVDTTWKIDAYEFAIPMMTHPTDATVTPEFAVTFGQLGGLPVINAEGLWGRVDDLDAALAEVRAAVDAGQAYDDFGGEHSDTDADADQGSDAPESPTAVLQRLHALPLNLDLLQERLAIVRDSGVRFAVRVSPQRARELAPAIISSGLDLLVIQGTLISAEHVTSSGEPLNLKEFIGSLDVPVIAGGVVDYTTALHLMRTGAAGVIVGSGDTWNNEVLGIDVPMATALSDAAAARRDYLDETGGRYVHVIADTSFLNSGDICRAIACGADAVSVGTLLASAKEAGTPGLYWSHSAGHPRAPRSIPQYTLHLGVGDPLAAEESAPTLEEVLYGPSQDATGESNLIGGLRRSMAKCGYTTIKSFQKVGLSIQS